MLLRPKYRHQYADAQNRKAEIQRLKELPRYVAGTTRLLGRTFSFPDAASFLAMHSEILEHEIYSFPSLSPAPLIIDGGANIGISVLYFKNLYPNCRVLAFEPDPAIFQILQTNINEFKLKQVELHCKAVWSSETTLEFMVEGADGGRIVENGASNQKISQIETVRLHDYLNQKVDFLKLDVEGAETEILKDCQDVLHNVQNLFVEWHSFVDQPQTLQVILEILEKAGFRYHIHQSVTSQHPFEERNLYHKMDMALNVFGFRG